jgi:cytochrome c
MDTFEVNKILGAFLGTCLFLVALNLVAGTIYAPAVAAKPGYVLAIPEHPPTETEAAKKVTDESIDQLLAKASIERGKEAARVCTNLIGLALWDIVDRPRASEPDFNYSAAMKAKGWKWTFEELNKFLTNPRGYIPGTLMTFAGIDHVYRRWRKRMPAPEQNGGKDAIGRRSLTSFPHHHIAFIGLRAGCCRHASEPSLKQIDLESTNENTSRAFSGRHHSSWLG